jgi:putative transposase
MEVAFGWSMTQPRQILPDRTYLVTRRTLRRHYLLTPDFFVNAVRDATDWPGLISNPKEIGKGTRTAKRPSKYLDQESEQWPEEATLTLQMPAILEKAYSNPLAVINNEYQELLKDARQELAAKGRHFMGPDRVKKLSPYQRATSWEDLRSLDPTFAVGRGQHEARALAIKALKTFRQTYRAALELWRKGERLVQFPAGTWWMTIFHGAPVADTG